MLRWWRVADVVCIKADSRWAAVYFLQMNHQGQQGLLLWVQKSSSLSSAYSSARVLSLLLVLEFGFDVVVCNLLCIVCGLM